MNVEYMNYELWCENGFHARTWRVLIHIMMVYRWDLNEELLVLTKRPFAIDVC